MTREEALKILNSRRSSKEELREALAWALDAPLPPKGGAKEPGAFNACKSAFYTEYRKTTGVAYNFGVKDGVALAGIIKKIEALDAPALITFTALVQNLPDWYKKNAFSLPVINSKFNEIIASIAKKTGAHSGNSAAREAVRNAFAGTHK